MFSVLERITLLTGTPIPNGLMDMWGQMYLLDHGERLGRTKSGYEREYFMNTGYNGYTLKPYAGSMRKVIDKVEDVAKTLKTEDYISLPPMIYNRVDVALPEDVMATYKKLEKNFFMSIDGEDVVAFNAASLATKLRQSVQGFIYDEEGVAHPIHTAKRDALNELVCSNPAEHFLIAVDFIYEAGVLGDIYKNSEVINSNTPAGKSTEIIKSWNEGKLKILFAHPASLSHGLNLQTGGRMVIWMGPTWNLEHWLQFNKRLHRSGQSRPVIVHTLIGKDTIDERVFAALRGKDVNQNKLIEGIIEHQKRGTMC